MANKRIYLKPRKEQSLLRFHPWVFSGAVAKADTGVENGELVDVYSSEGEFLARGHYQAGSIMVRLLTFEDEEIGPAFWLKKLSQAFELRHKLGLIDNLSTNCYRLVHGEGDYLPGLIVDIYDSVAVMQTHSAGMYSCRAQIANALVELYGRSLAVYSKATQIGTFEGDDDYLYKSASFLEDSRGGEVVLENGCKFLVDWQKGQKTGFFLDQRDNRALVRSYSSGKRVLNLFCYTGGFTIYALMGGALCADSVDSSKYAIGMVRNNLEINSFQSTEDKNRAICADAIEYLRSVKKGEYDLIIVDPPAFAKHLSAKSNALRAYQRLNALAIEKVAEGGMVFTFSCSQVVDKQDFSLAVFSAAAQTGRNVRIIERLSQPADHPVSIYHPEGEYLKGLALYVE
ncbi:MAG: class I SAM-dependent rRNA methyltransferase, partial [Bacteroidales bacterium]|nr:class I SAM-dependent rRNA methyltransferase [Bacteroidales bacterium]